MDVIHLTVWGGGFIWRSISLYGEGALSGDPSHCMGRGLYLVDLIFYPN